MYEFGIGSTKRDHAEALRWYGKAAAQGNRGARLSIAGMYFAGIGVKRDYAEAARWYSCPKPSEEILAGCKVITYSDLPAGAREVLRKRGCRVGPGDNYDYGSAVDLNGDGTPEYQFCCDYAEHGPCSSVLLGKIGSEWKELNSGLAGFTPACGLVVVLASQQGGYHDICLPNQCSSFDAKTCRPTIWQFNHGRYDEVKFTPPAKPSK
jgi:hypothetical protein